MTSREKGGRGGRSRRPAGTRPVASGSSPTAGKRRPGSGAAARPAPPAAREEPRLEDDGLPEAPEPAELGEVLVPEIAYPFDDGASEPEAPDDGRARRGRKRAGATKGGKDGAVTRYDPLGGYVREVRAIPPLSREEEQELARRYRASGDPDAARRLVVANLSLVVKIALMFRRAIANALDLIQEGNVGLLQAVEKFDPDMGVRFTTYAAWWVKAYILKYLLDNARLVRVGTTNARRKLIYNLQREKARLDALGIETGPKLLAERFGVSEEDVRDVQATLEGGEVALDAPVADGEDRTRASLLADPDESVEEQVARRELQQTLEEKIRAFAVTLSERDRTILENRLLADDPLTLQAIGERFNVTREAVRLSEERLVRQLKDYLRTELGEDVLLQVRR